MLTILFFCSLITYIFGLFLISLCDNILANFLKIRLKVEFKIFEFLVIQFFSMIIFLIFAKPALDTIDQIKVRNLFRNSNSNLSFNYNRKSLIGNCYISTNIYFCILYYKRKTRSNSLFLFFLSSYNLFFITIYPSFTF